MSKADTIKKSIQSFKKYIDNLEKQQNYLYNAEDYYKDDIEQNELLLKMLHSVLNYIDNSISKEEYNKIKEENEMLKQEKKSRIIGKYGEMKVHDLIKQTLSKDFISKEAIEEKIEELNKGIKRDMENHNKVKAESWKIAIHRSMTQKIETKKVLHELLEGK
ncbi:MAG: hypothetical protein HFJ41_03845 [Clostridia bacterium]|nr:hypothetical protein [Clostridia bacterium]